MVVGGDGGGKLLEFFFVDLPETWVEFSDLRSLVETLIQRWRAGAYWQGRDGAVEEDRRAVAAIWRAAERTRPNINLLLTALD